MDPGPIPSHLPKLSWAEENLIALIMPVMRLTMTNKGTIGYKGNVINIPQDISSFAESLPRHPCELPEIIIRRQGLNPSDHEDYQVNAHNVRTWLLFLKQNHPDYRDIRLNEENLAALPISGSIFNHIEVVDLHENNDPDAEDIDPEPAVGPNAEPELEQRIHATFIPVAPTDGQTETAAILNVLRAVGQTAQQQTQRDPEPGNTTLDDHVQPSQPIIQHPHQNWTNPANESIPRLASKCFPTLFPFGKGDVWNSRHTKVSRNFMSY
jgi:hypothetical protein